MLVGGGREEKGGSGTDGEEAGDRVFPSILSGQNSKESENSKPQLAFRVILKVYLSRKEARTYI